MYTIDEFRSPTHATYHIPREVHRECGSESIIRVLEAEATTAQETKLGKVRSFAVWFWRRFAGPTVEAAQQANLSHDSAVRPGN
jgi:hypothetical protein